MKFGKRITNLFGATTLSALILFSSLVATPQSTYASHNINVGGKAVVTNTDGDTIRVRADAGTESAQIAEAYEGQTVSVLAGPRRDAKGNRWFKVQGPGGTGWVVAGFLENKEGAAVAEKPVAKPAAEKKASKLVGFARISNTDGDPLRIRASAGADSKVLTMMKPETVTAVKAGPVTDDNGTVWYKVSANGVTGWAMAQYLVQSKAPAQEPAAEKKVQPEASKPATIDKPAAPVAEKPQAEPVSETRSGSARGVEPALTEASYVGRGESVMNIAMRFVGSRYVMGGTTPRGFDCSGFAYYVYNQAGVRLSRNMHAQLNSGPRISSKDLQPGDLVFWQNTYKRGLSHVGVYIGGGKFVHAANYGVGVVVSSMNTAYWASRYVGAVRPR